MWIAKSDLVSNKGREKYLYKASCEANSAVRGVQPRLSCEAKAKAPLCADNVVDTALLSLPTLSARKVLSCKARTKALFSAIDLSHEAKNEAPLSASSEAISVCSRKELCYAELSSPSKTELKQ